MGRLAAMFILFFAGTTTAYWAEAGAIPFMPRKTRHQGFSAPVGGNMEGKEVRFGIANSPSSP